MHAVPEIQSASPYNDTSWSFSLTRWPVSSSSHRYCGSLTTIEWIYSRTHLHRPFYPLACGNAADLAYFANHPCVSVTLGRLVIPYYRAFHFFPHALWGEPCSVLCIPFIYFCVPLLKLIINGDGHILAEKYNFDLPRIRFSLRVCGYWLIGNRVNIDPDHSQSVSDIKLNSGLTITLAFDQNSPLRYEKKLGDYLSANATGGIILTVYWTNFTTYKPTVSLFLTISSLYIIYIHWLLVHFGLTAGLLVRSTT